MKSAEDRLREFQTQNNIATKGPLSLVIQFTRLVRDKEFPLNSDDFQTSSKGQVAGLGGANLRKILKELRNSCLQREEEQAEEAWVL